MRLVEYNRDDRSIVPQPPPIYRFHTYTPCARSTDDRPAPDERRRLRPAPFLL